MSTIITRKKFGEGQLFYVVEDSRGDVVGHYRRLEDAQTAAHITDMEDEERGATSPPVGTKPKSNKSPTTKTRIEERSGCTETGFNITAWIEVDAKTGRYIRELSEEEAKQYRRQREQKKQETEEAEWRATYKAYVGSMSTARPKRKQSRPKHNADYSATEKGPKDPGWGKIYRTEAIKCIVRGDLPPRFRSLARALALEICSHLNGKRTDGLVFCTRKSLCEATGAGLEHVRQTLKVLEGVGFIERGENGKIRVLLPEGEAKRISSKKARRKKWSTHS